MTTPKTVTQVLREAAEMTLGNWTSQTQRDRLRSALTAWESSESSTPASTPESDARLLLRALLIHAASLDGSAGVWVGPTATYYEFKVVDGIPILTDEIRAALLSALRESEQTGEKA